MITGERAKFVDSLEDSDGSDEEVLEATGTSHSRLSSEARRRASSQAHGAHFIEKSKPKDLQLVRKSVSCINTVGAGFADPFQTVPELAGGDTEALMHHWRNVITNKTRSAGWRRCWFSSSIGDPATFHGIMHISASHLAALQRSRPSVAYYQHRGEVIRLVNKRIAYNQNATSDGTIGAIASLVISDSMSGHPERVRAHISGIQQLVSARGGISNLHHLIQRLVRCNLTDFCQLSRAYSLNRIALLVSITFLERPLFSPPNMIDPDLSAYYGPPSLSTTSYTLAFCTRLVNFTIQQKPSELAAKILWGLRNLSILKETIHTTKSLSYESILFSDRVELIERETERLLHDTLQMNAPGCTSKMPSPSLIFTLFAYATLIYINSVFRDLVPSFITIMLADRLELGMDIDDTELNTLLGTFPELMLWTLFLGGGATRPNSKVWFAKTASKILRMQKLEDEPGIVAASTSFLWPEGRENYNGTTEHDIDINDISEVEVAFSSVLPSAVAKP